MYFETLPYACNHRIKSGPVTANSWFYFLEFTVILLAQQNTEDLEDVYAVIDAMKSKLNRIAEPEDALENDKEEDPSNVKMTPGQMLLAGFNGLFTKVESELNALHETFKKLQTFEGMEHVDLQQEQKNLKVSLLALLLPYLTVLL